MFIFLPQKFLKSSTYNEFHEKKNAKYDELKAAIEKKSKTNVDSYKDK